MPCKLLVKCIVFIQMTILKEVWMGKRGGYLVGTQLNISVGVAEL